MNEGILKRAGLLTEARAFNIFDTLRYGIVGGLLTI